MDMRRTIHYPSDEGRMRSCNHGDLRICVVCQYDKYGTLPKNGSYRNRSLWEERSQYRRSNPIAHVITGILVYAMCVSIMMIVHILITLMNSRIIKPLSQFLGGKAWSLYVRLSVYAHQLCQSGDSLRHQCWHQSQRYNVHNRGVWRRGLLTRTQRGRCSFR